MSANDLILFCAELLDRLVPQSGIKLVGVGSLAGGIIGENPDLDILASGVLSHEAFLTIFIHN